MKITIQQIMMMAGKKIDIFVITLGYIFIMVSHTDNTIDLG